ncbi:hypothetical protein HNY73_004978 [Argiope bruennichi]|uniref:Uncharacterized protein n=1 Tax=Argiope bruennichi TaxID=94029 RepID=A0A8T0FRQ2_ARGBR|nr:hypothetical protein HNY73_004978 [Argiope bruennichi]
MGPPLRRRKIAVNQKCALFMSETCIVYFGTEDVAGRERMDATPCDTKRKEKVFYCQTNEIKDLQSRMRCGVRKFSGERRSSSRERSGRRPVVYRQDRRQVHDVQKE